MADISKINVNNTTYNLKDNLAIANCETINGVTKYTRQNNESFYDQSYLYFVVEVTKANNVKTITNPRTDWATLLSAPKFFIVNFINGWEGSQDLFLDIGGTGVNGSAKRLYIQNGNEQSAFPAGVYLIWYDGQVFYLSKEGLNPGYIPDLPERYDNATKITSWNAGTLPNLTLNSTSVSGRTSTKTVLGATALTLVDSSETDYKLSLNNVLVDFSYNEVSVGSGSNWSAGSLPTLSSNNVTVIH